MQKTKIAIGVVDNHPFLSKPFFMSITGVMLTFQQWASRQKDHEYVVDLLLAENGGIDDMRNTVANQAVREGYDMVFWMDSDMTFPHDCLIRLVQYLEKDGYEAVSGLYTYKTPPFMPHVYGRMVDGGPKFEVAAGFPLRQPFKVEGAGFGCLLMKVDVFNRVEKPYFTMKFEDGKMTAGEDLSFCAKAKMNMILDPTVVCGHLLQRSFGIEDYIRWNNLTVIDDWVRCSKEQKDAIVRAMDKTPKEKT
jgi:hypothetical protein